MAYNLVVDTNNFKPFTFLDLMAPLALYKTDYDKEAEMYYKVLESMGDLSTAVLDTTKAKPIYDNYNNRLLPAFEDFNTNGKTIANTKLFADLRKTYATDIKMLEKAKERMILEAGKRRLEMSSGNYAYRKTNLNLDDFIDSSADHSGVNLEKLATKVGAEAESIVRALYSSPTFNFDDVVGRQKFVMRLANGIEPSTLDALFTLDTSNLNEKDRDTINRLKSIMDKERKQLDYNSFDEIGRRKIDDALHTGMYNSVANPKYQMVNNEDHLNALLQASLKHTNLANQYQQLLNTITRSMYNFIEDEDGKEIVDPENPYTEFGKSVKENKNKNNSKEYINIKYSLAGDNTLEKTHILTKSDKVSNPRTMAGFSENIYSRIDDLKAYTKKHLKNPKTNKPISDDEVAEMFATKEDKNRNTVWANTDSAIEAKRSTIINIFKAAEREGDYLVDFGFAGEKTGTGFIGRKEMESINTFEVK